MADQNTLNAELIEALGCSTTTARISFVDNDGVARVAVENLRQLERSLEAEGNRLDDLLSHLHRRSFYVPVACDPNADPHCISFEERSGSHVLMVNSPHTDGDVQVQDLRIASVAPVAIQGVRYRSYFVALEVFREHGGDDSMFQLGVYLVEANSERLAFHEAENIRVTGPGARSVLTRVLMEFARRLCSLEYAADIVQKKLLQPAQTVLLAGPLRELGHHAVSIPLGGYLEKLRDIFAYLQGANIEERTKFQHNFDPATKGLLYRVQLSRPNLPSLSLAGRAGDVFAVVTFRKPPGYRREEEIERRLCSIDDGERGFLEACEQCLESLYREAGLLRRHFALAPFHKQEGLRSVPCIDLRYVTVLRTRDDQPLVATHWRVRHDQQGNPLPRSHYLDRFQFWNGSGEFVGLENGRDFHAGMEQVKDISKQIIACAHQIDAARLPALAQQLVDSGVQLRYQRKT
jgi:hypothetical protein